MTKFSKVNSIIHRRHKLSLDGSLIPDDIQTLKKKFIIRLLVALHATGIMTFRTEHLIRRVSKVIDVYTTCTIFPKRVIMSFQQELTLDDPSKNEAYTFKLNESWDMNKLSLLEKLCHEMCKDNGRIDFFTAEQRLQEIENLSQLYPNPTMAATYFTASFTSCMLFYGGNLVESLWAGVFGTIVFGIILLTERLTRLSEIVSFASAFIVSILATVLDNYVYNGQLCLFGTMYAGIVWLMPGLSITVALLEIYSGMVVYGSSKLIYGVSQASQLGFGLALGHVFASESVPLSFISGCKDPVADGWGFVLLPIAAACFSMMINASWRQIPGMVFTCAIGQFSGYWLTKSNVNSNVVSFLCAMLVTTAARLFAWARDNDRPMIYKISGLIVLVPGGIGVRGSFNTTLSGDASSGMSFTFNMVMIGITLAVGVFVSLIPSAQWVLPLKKTPLKSMEDIFRTIDAELGHGRSASCEHDAATTHSIEFASGVIGGNYEEVVNPMQVEMSS